MKNKGEAMFKKSNTKPSIKREKVNINDYILDDRLYEFTKKIKEIAKDKDKASILAKQFSELIKADKNFKS